MVLDERTREMLMELTPERLLVLRCGSIKFARKLVRAINRWLGVQRAKGVLSGEYEVQMKLVDGEPAVVVRKLGLDGQVLDEEVQTQMEAGTAKRISLYLNPELAYWVKKWMDEVGVETYGKAILLILKDFVERKYGKKIGV